MSAITAIQILPPPPSRLSKFCAFVMARKVAALALAVLCLLILAAVLAPWVTPYLPNKLSIVNRPKPPSGGFWCVTDAFGRDGAEPKFSGGWLVPDDDLSLLNTSDATTPISDSSLGFSS